MAAIVYAVSFDFCIKPFTYLLMAEYSVFIFDSITASLKPAWSTYAKNYCMLVSSFAGSVCTMCVDLYLVYGIFDVTGFHVPVCWMTVY